MVSTASPLARSDAGVEHVDLQFRRRLESHLQSASAARKRLGSTRASRVGASPARTFGALAEKLVSFHSKPVVIMTPTHSSTLVTEVPRYAKLQREIHYALRAQDPEWIEANGSSPTCDYYESRFSELLVGHNHPDLGSSSIAVAT
jgi:hypothetical protein